MPEKALGRRSVHKAGSNGSIEFSMLVGKVVA